MSRTLVAMNESLLVSVAVSTTRPTTALHGADVTSWRTNGVFCSPLVAVFIDGTTTQTIDSPTGGTQGVELWGYRLSQWWLIGHLNEGSVIEIAGADQGFAASCNTIGVFERLSVAGTVSSGTAAAKMVPIDSWATS